MTFNYLWVLDEQRRASHLSNWKGKSHITLEGLVHRPMLVLVDRGLK